MQPHTSVKCRRWKRRHDSFSLVELLTVIAIIGILAALVLAAASGVLTNAARNRAKTEIAAIGNAAEAYKIDNGVYPQVSLLLTNAYASTDGTTAGGLYQQSSQALYQALSGRTDYTDFPVAGVKSYMSFKMNQLSNASAPTGTTAADSTFIQEPWNYAYGYSTGPVVVQGVTPTSTPYNGTGFFDLWTTGGATAANGTVATNGWIANFPL